MKTKKIKKQLDKEAKKAHYERRKLKKSKRYQWQAIA